MINYHLVLQEPKEDNNALLSLLFIGLFLFKNRKLGQLWREAESGKRLEMRVSTGNVRLAVEKATSFTRSLEHCYNIRLVVLTTSESFAFAPIG